MEQVVVGLWYIVLRVGVMEIQFYQVSEQGLDNQHYWDWLDIFVKESLGWESEWDKYYPEWVSRR
jgi:hypothetical protein